MGLFKYIEYALGTILYPFRSHDSALFTKLPAFKSHPNPTITITSTDCGASGSPLKIEHAIQGRSLFPTLEWTCDLPDVKEFMLIVEDPDAPVWFAPVHGLFWGIPATARRLGPDDIELESSKDDKNEVPKLRSQVRVGKNAKGARPVYAGAGAPLGHGAHRYFYTLAALGEILEPAALSKLPDRKELATAIEGKVVAWGEWIGTYEKQWF